MVNPLVERLEEMDRSLQMKATGATVHLINNMRMYLSSIRHEIEKEGNNKSDDALMALIFNQLPGILMEFGEFIRDVGEMCKDGRLTKEEALKIEDIWIRVAAHCSIFLVGLRSLAPNGNSTKDPH